MAEERVHRRLAAILAADVVGYSRLMGSDEPGTLSRLRTLRSEVFDPKTEQFGGRIFKTTGDGTLAEFGSAVDAVQCSVEIQRELGLRNADAPEDQRMAIRIGISLGDVVVDGDDLFGNGVNVAARMEGLAEPGGICVSGNVHEHIGNTLDVALEDLGEQSVKNIDRPVRCYRVHLEAGGAREAPLPLPDKPSIAVLPFDNLSGDPEQAYFADGITEDIITELSRFRSLFVIARNSSFAFRGENIDVPKVGRELGVKYVVEGSIRKAANRIRVTAQLIDASTGAHVWADRYDRDLEDIFAVQDELTQAIVAILPGRLEDSDRDHASRKRTSSLSAYEYLLLGNEHLRRHSREEIAEARRNYQNAIDLDPDYARARALLSWTYACDAYRGSWQEPCVDDALRSIENSLAIDDDDSWAHGVFGQVLLMHNRADEVEIQFERALALNPNDADVAALWAPTLVYLGRWEEGLDWINKAKRLNPFPGQWYHWYRGFALFSARDYEQAVRAIKELTPIHLRGHAYLAACYAYMDRMHDAQRELIRFEEAWEREKAFIGEHALPSIREVALDWADRYSKSEDQEHFLDGLRKGGWEG